MTKAASSAQDSATSVFPQDDSHTSVCTRSIWCYIKYKNKQSRIKFNNFLLLLQGHEVKFFKLSVGQWKLQWLLVQVGAPALICERCQQYYPPLLFYHHCKCQNSGKGKECLSIRKIVLTPCKCLRDPQGLCRVYFVNHKIMNPIK